MVGKEEEKWFVANEEDGCNLYALHQWVDALRYDMEKVCGESVRSVFEIDNGRMRWHIRESEAEERGKRLLEKILKSPEWAIEIEKKLVESCDRLEKFSNGTIEKEISGVSDEELKGIFREHKKLLTEMLGYGLPTSVLEVPHATFTKKLEEMIRKRTEELKLERKPSEYFAVLSSATWESAARKELKELLELASELLKDSEITGLLKKDGKEMETELKEKHPEAWKKIEEHAKKNEWVYYGYEGPVWGTEKFLKELSEIAKEEKNITEHMERMEKEFPEIERKRKDYEKELQLSEYEKELFRAIRSVVFTKMYRKDAATFSLYAMEKCLKELAKRAGITLKQARYCVVEEIAEILKGNADKNALHERSEFCIYSTVGEKPEIFAGTEAKEYLKKYVREEKIEDVKELNGMCACVGYAKGKVRIINKPEDMKKMEKGGILVSIATTPEIVPAMKKAAAIVSDIGGITSHAAIVSRELNVPCVVGTKIATKVLKDGDLVEVDADNGIVRKI